MQEAVWSWQDEKSVTTVGWGWRYVSLIAFAGLFLGGGGHVGQPFLDRSETPERARPCIEWPDSTRCDFVGLGVGLCACLCLSDVPAIGDRQDRTQLTRSFLTRERCESGRMAPTGTEPTTTATQATGALKGEPTLSFWRYRLQLIVAARTSWRLHLEHCPQSWKCIRSGVSWCCLLLFVNAAYWLFGGLLFASLEGASIMPSLSVKQIIALWKTHVPFQCYYFSKG